MLQDFLTNILNNTEIGEDRARIGLLTFNDEAGVNFHLNSYYSKEDVMQVSKSYRHSRRRQLLSAAAQFSTYPRATLLTGH